MNNMKTTKRALGTSIVALIMCFAMLVGTTYAWFTDTVTSSGNVIKSGKLDVALTWSEDYDVDEANWNNVEADNAAPIFSGDILWEPGYTAVRYLKVENLGNLALQYKLQIVTNGALENADGIKLSDAIDVYYSATKTEVVGRDVSGLNYLGTLTQFLTGAAVADTLEEEGDADYATLVLKMNENAGNEYQNLSVGTSFDVVLFATQLAYESDSVDDQYDVNSTWPAHGTASGNAADAVLGDLELIVYNTTNTEPTTGEQAKLATFQIPVGAIADESKDVVITVTETTDGNGITLNDGESTKSYQITVENLDPDNTELIDVYLRVGADKNVVAVYHYDEEIDFTYDSNSGNVRFQTATFSPFTVVISNEPAPEGDSELPNATINNITAQQPEGGYTYGFVGTNFSGLTLEDPDELNAVYQIIAKDTSAEAQANKYADWKCDFFVKVNKDIEANTIILAGQYDAFSEDWVAFSNPVAVDGETYIPLLLLVSNGWTYEDIVSGVGTFNCGVKDVNGSLATNGVIFTVQLRLVDPNAADLQNPVEGEYIVIDEVSYNFATGTSSK